MAEVTDRHRQLAAELDLAIVEEETEEAPIEEMSVRVQALIAGKLAEFQEELSRDQRFIMAAAQALSSAWLPQRIPHCECNLLLPASMRCSRQIARCHARCAHFVEQGNARDEKRRKRAEKTTTAQSGQYTEGQEP